MVHFISIVCEVGELGCQAHCCEASVHKLKSNGNPSILHSPVLACLRQCAETLWETLANEPWETISLSSVCAYLLLDILALLWSGEDENMKGNPSVVLSCCHFCCYDKNAPTCTAERGTVLSGSQFQVISVLGSQDRTSSSWSRHSHSQEKTGYMSPCLVLSVLSDLLHT